MPPRKKKPQKLLSKEAFLAQDDASYEEVNVPPWGTVRVRSLTGAGRDQYLSKAFTTAPDGSRVAKTEDTEAHLLALTLVDEDGKPWFEDVDEGIRVLRERNAGSLQRAFFAALKLNHLEAGDLEELAENLEPAQSADSGSS